jgi:O-antigen/teichoic acid export membrane protein
VRDTWSLVAQTSGSRIYWVLATLLTTVITARYLGPERRGVFVAAVSWATMFSTFGHLSLAQVTIYIAAEKPEDQWLPPLLGSLLTIFGVVTVVAWLLAAILYAATGGEFFHHLDVPVAMLAFAAVPALMWIESGNGILMALGKLPVMNIAQIIGATATLLLTFVFLGVAHLGLHGALTAILIAQAITVAVSLGYLLRRVPALRPDGPMIRQLLGGSAKLHLNAVGTYLFMQANVLILNHYRSPSETAYYQLAVQLMTGLQIIPMAVSAVAYSLVSRLGPDAAWPQQRKLLFQVTLLVIVLALIGVFVAPYVVPVLFGKSFLPAVPVFRILLWGVAGMCMSIVMASQWISRGLFLQAALLTLLFGAATVTGNYLFVPKYGMYGAAWVTVGTYTASVVGNGIMALWVERRSRRAAAAATA